MVTAKHMTVTYPWNYTYGGNVGGRNSAFSPRGSAFGLAILCDSLIGRNGVGQTDWQQFKYYAFPFQLSREGENKKLSPIKHCTIKTYVGMVV
jgi:hypothetical protein